MENLLPKTFEMPDVPNKFNGNFPANFRPWVPGWSVKNTDILRETLDDGTLAMHQMDIHWPSDEFAQAVNEGFAPGQVLSDADKKVINHRYRSLYQEKACGVGCNHCFDCLTEHNNLLLTTDEIFKIIREAKVLGLKSLKFLGPGEFLHNPDLFKILDFVRDLGIHFGIFTKGVILGDDDLCQKKFGEGFGKDFKAKDLAEKLAEYDNVTILFSITSADEKTENLRCTSRKFPDIFNIRNRGFENLVEAGLNKDPDNQRLALLCAPVLNDNVDEVLKIYEWALDRNIPVVAPPTMISGKGLEMPEVHDDKFKNEKLVNLFIDIYIMLIKKKILTVAQIETEGISPYPGYICNQFIDGMLIESDGSVQACPGNKEFRYDEDVRKKPLKEIWKKSLGYKLKKQLIESDTLTLTQPCYAKTEELVMDDKNLPVVQKGCGSIPNDLYEKVMAGIKKKIMETIG